GGVTEERDDKLVERRVWLQGVRSGRRAWLLDHAFGGRGFEQSWLTGTSVEATFVFFPGASGLRALLADSATAPGSADWPRPALTDEWQAVAKRVAQCPWVSLHPMVVTGAVSLRAGDRSVLVADGHALPLALGESDTWGLLAYS